MALTINDKERIVADLRARLESASSLIVTHYRGVTVGEISKLRSKGIPQGVAFKVTRNTLSRIALKGTAYEPLVAQVKGPVMLAFSAKEPSAAARLLKEFLGPEKPLAVVAFGVGGLAYSGAELEKLATLPTKEEAIAQLARVLLEPVRQVATTLNEVPSKLARALKAHASALN